MPHQVLAALLSMLVWQLLAWALLVASRWLPWWPPSAPDGYAAASPLQAGQALLGDMQAAMRHAKVHPNVLLRIALPVCSLEYLSCFAERKRHPSASLMHPCLPDVVPLFILSSTIGQEALTAAIDA